MKVLIGFCILAVALAARPEVKKTCTEKPESGMCMAAFRMWYYDPETGSCKRFIYGGCQGNGNRYRSEQECLDNCKGVTGEPQQLSDHKDVDCNALPDADSGDVLDAIMPLKCDCSNSTCSCCGQLKVPVIRLDQKVCAEVGYDEEKVALKVLIKANDKIVFNKSISATNPPLVCVGMPPMSMWADVCFDFYDIKVTLERIFFCMNLKPRLVRKEVLDMKVGCLNFNRFTLEDSTTLKETTLLDETTTLGESTTLEEGTF